MKRKYLPSEIEPKWQRTWDEEQIYKADLKSNKPKYISMSMFNYPSGAGIHIGHAMNYTISDVLARFKRQQGFESYHPVGWDSFGLPAENYAIKAGVSPQQSMQTIIPNYHKQYKAMGWSNDWSKEIATHLPEYYKWSQWIFSEMYRSGLVYQDVRMQWWCDKCQTVLANEQVINGKCWRHDSASDVEVAQREVKQWFFKITDYAEEMLEAIESLDWTESVKLAQINWIGKSVGAELKFEIRDSKFEIDVFTTRPDTIFGATFLVLAPESELIGKITSPEQKSVVESYIMESLRKSEVDRQASKEKTGVFTGSYAVHPLTGETLPIWVGDYVVMNYGTGAIMAVPAHDERDYAFAKKFNLPITQVVAPETGTKRDNEERRDGGCTIVFDPKTQKYAVNKAKDNYYYRLFAGGVAEGENKKDGILREMAEESGLYDFGDVIEIETQLVRYYNRLKKLNRVGLATSYLVILKSTDTHPQKLESHEEGFTLEWHSAEEILENWESRNEHGDLDHWISSLKKAVAVAIERQVDMTTKGKQFVFEPFTGEGMMINSRAYDGMESSEAREKIVSELEKVVKGREKVNYKMRDWSVTRQRYWGAPTPIIYCPDHGPVLVPDEDLPVILPELTDFAPSGDGRSALARATEWLKAPCPTCGKMGERETDTLDTYICSSWYYLRYFDPQNDEKLFDTEIVNKWMPIDFYNGADHATAHMMYARFVMRFFYKKGLAPTPEPFKKFLFNGKVTAADGQMFSKSKGNGVDPLQIIEEGYGADALRMYLMFAAPLELWIRWDEQGVPAMFRFLNRVWTLVQEYLEANIDDSTENIQVLRSAHKAALLVTEDLEIQHYNTSIASTMELTNELYRIKLNGFSGKQSWQTALETLVMLIAPFSPHISEELWHLLGHSDSVHVGNWPTIDKTYLEADSVTIAITVNGKLRDSLVIPSSEAKEQAVVEEKAKTSEKVKKYLEGQEIKKVIFVSGKLINFVV
jgi:leucyl-tRNA synthetase